MERLIVNPKYAHVFAQRGWNTFSAVFTHFFPHYTRRTKMTVQRVTIPTADGELDAFFKIYHHRRSGWRFWLRSSKARCEFENYAVFDQLGVSAAERVACGEERNLFGRLQRAFIITRAIPEARELGEFFRSQPARAQREHALQELAGMVRRLHAAHFYYYDLVWRNIMVEGTATNSPPKAQPRLYFLDCPRGGFGRFGRARKRIRDLASLDKTACQLCSRTERLRFVLRYLQQTRLDKTAKALVRDCLLYRRHRWPEDWKGK